MRGILGVILVLVIALIAAFALGFINLDAKGGKLPEIRADGGRLPNVDVQTGSVEMGTKNTTVAVPTVDVKRADERK